MKTLRGLILPLLAATAAQAAYIPVDFAAASGLTFAAQTCEVGCTTTAASSPIENVVYSAGGVEFQNWFDGRFDVDFQPNGIVVVTLLKEITLRNSFEYNMAFYFEPLPDATPYRYTSILLTHSFPQMTTSGWPYTMGHFKAVRWDFMGDVIPQGTVISAQIVVDHNDAPEPSTLAMLGAGLAGLAWWRARARG